MCKMAEMSTTKNESNNTFFSPKRSSKSPANKRAMTEAAINDPTINPTCCSVAEKALRAKSGSVGINKLKIINKVNALKHTNKNVGVQSGCFDMVSHPLIFRYPK